MGQYWAMTPLEVIEELTLRDSNVDIRVIKEDRITLGTICLY